MQVQSLRNKTRTLNNAVASVEMEGYKVSEYESFKTINVCTVARFMVDY